MSYIDEVAIGVSTMETLVTGKKILYQNDDNQLRFQSNDGEKPTYRRKKKLLEVIHEKEKELVKQCARKHQNTFIKQRKEIVIFWKLVEQEKMFRSMEDKSK